MLKIRNIIDKKEALLQWSINVFIKKTCGSGIKKENLSNKELANELNKSIIRKLEKRKLHSPFIDDVKGADLADRQLKSKFN